MFAAILAALERIGGEALLKSMASRGAGAAARAGAEEATAKARMTKVDKGIDAFNRLFKDHPSHQPPPLPDRRPAGQKAFEQAGDYFKKKLEQMKGDPIGSATKVLSNTAQAVDSGKSIGQGIVDTMKKLDPTGLVGLASAGVDLVTGVAARGYKAGEKIVRDDFVGLLDEVLPDAFRKVVHAANDLVNALVEKGRYLGKFSGPLAQVSAEADVRKLRRDIYEAQQNGRGYSRVIEQQSVLEDKLSRALMPVRDGIAEIFGSALEKLNQLFDMSMVREVLALLGEGQRFFAAVMSMDPERIADAILEMPERVADALFKKPEDKESYMQVIDNALADLKRMGPGLAGPARPMRPNNGLGFGVVKGM